MCRFIHVYLTQEALREAATLFLPKTSLEDFWDPPVFNRFRYDQDTGLSGFWQFRCAVWFLVEQSNRSCFRKSLASLDTWEEQNIFVVGAQHVTEGVEVSLVISDRGRVVK